MEPSKKDFSPEQLKKLLREIEQSPAAKQEPAKTTEDADFDTTLVQSLGEELEEVPLFGADSSASRFEAPSPQATTIKEHSMENWLREIADQKIDEMLKKQNLADNINQILREVLPTMSETLITREIEKIKEQIKGL